MTGRSHPICAARSFSPPNAEKKPISIVQRIEGIQMAAHKMFPLPYPLTLAWAAMTLRWRGSGLAMLDSRGHNGARDLGRIRVPDEAKGHRVAIDGSSDSDGVDSHLTTIEPRTRQFGLPA